MFEIRRVALPVVIASLVAGCAYPPPGPSYAQSEPQRYDPPRRYDPPQRYDPPRYDPPQRYDPPRYDPPQRYEQPVGRGEVVRREAANTGVVTSIELVRGEQRNSISPGGAIIGAVVGGLLGNQIGEGRGRTAATVAGAGAGALAGNAIGQRTQSGPELYRVGIQYDRGGSQFIDVPNPGDLRPGDRVQIDDGQISRY